MFSRRTWLCFGAIFCLGAGLQATAQNFQRVSTFADYTNNSDISDETVSEIVAATRDGRTLIYTDSELEEVGFVDITDPKVPVPAGKVALDGEPTAVATIGNRLAVVGVNTSESFTNPSGHLAVINITQRAVVRKIELGGQPDSVAVSPNIRYIAVAIENERDEEICVGGSQSGAPVPEDGPENPGDISEDDCEAAGGEVGTLPQTIPSIGNPPGFLAIVDRFKGWSVTKVDLTGLATYAPEDPEPEFVDINRFNQAVVSLQENNHIAIVNLRSGKVVADFDAGSVDLENVDANEDGIISLTDSLEDVPREPDAITWIPNGCGRSYGIGTANEGDLFGGSRGFTIFCPTGRVLFESGSALEAAAVSIGQYNEDRSENKGSEPEAIEYGNYRGRDFLFVGAERGGFLAVYTLGRGKPHLRQLLPAPLRPEGVLAIPSRDLLVVSGESDDPTFGVRANIMIYRLENRPPSYPQIASQDDIGFSALSGMTAVPGDSRKALAVWDAFYEESNIFTVNVRQRPAMITEATTISGRTSEFTYDPEGIAVAPDDTLWIASEGNDPGTRPNLLVQTDSNGNVLQEVALPEDIEACRLASDNQPNLDNGFEGIAIQPAEAGYNLLVAQQLPWFYTTSGCEDLDDDEGFSRIWIYDTNDQSWSSIAYELTPTPENASWVGLSEISYVGDGYYLLIERDNRTGDFAEVKDLVLINIKDAEDGVISANEKRIYSIIPDLLANNGWISDKPEGTAVTDDGQVYLVTDNDGLDDWSGENWFLRLGTITELFSL